MIKRRRRRRTYEAMRNCIAMQTRPNATLKSSQPLQVQLISFHVSRQSSDWFSTKGNLLFVLWHSLNRSQTACHVDCPCNNWECLQGTGECQRSLWSSSAEPPPVRPSFISISLSLCLSDVVFWGNRFFWRSAEEWEGRHRIIPCVSNPFSGLASPLLTYYSKETSPSEWCQPIWGAKCAANNLDLIRELQNSERS